ncbi:MAG: class I SAM-dependent methyltransferase [Planctomycetota bacterium]
MHERDPLPAILGETDIYVIDQILRGNIAPTMRVLDAGLGRGRNVRYLLKAGYSVMGFDPEPKAVELVQAMQTQLVRNGDPDSFRVGTLEANDFADGCANVVLVNAVLHFAQDLEHWRRMVHGAWRLLAPGGLFFARLATSIGIEPLLSGGTVGFMRLPDTSWRFLVDADLLESMSNELHATWVDPLKTTVVHGQRSMSTWVLRKP